MAGKFSCNACGKTYTWKPELAGKRVKCKCGQPMSIPATDPAGDGDLGDLAALAEGAPSTPGAVAGGPTCPGCGSSVDPAAVICVNCGQNLKTGKKLKTSKVAAATAGGGVADNYAPGYRSYGAVTSDEGMSPKQKKLVIASSVGGLLAVIAVICAIVIPRSREANRRLAQIQAQPAKLEHALTAMDENGGLVGALRSGALADGGGGAVGAGGAAVAPLTPAAAADAAEQQRARSAYTFNERHQTMLAGAMTKVGKKFLLNPKAKFHGKTREETEKIVNDVYKMGCSSVMILSAGNDIYTGDEMASGLIATLPTDKDARTKIFAYYHTLENTIEPMDMESQSDKGQKWISIEFRDPKADKPANWRRN